MLDILEQYLTNPKSEGSIDSLNQESEALRGKIAVIQRKLANINLKQLRQSDQQDTRHHLKKLLGTPKKWLQEENDILQFQAKELKLLSTYLELYQQPVGKQPRELEQKIKKLQAFQAESKDLGCSASQRTLLSQLTNELIQSQQKKLKELVSNYRTHLRVNVNEIKIYRDLLNEEICKEYVKLLYKNLFVYDVPTFSYVLQTITSIKTDQDTVNAARESIVFTSDQSQKYFQQLFSAIERVRELLEILKVSFQAEDPLKAVLDVQKNFEEESLKAQIQYILPFLSLQKRKQLIFSFNNIQNQQASLFDILVRFRVKGQDGQILSANVEALTKKIRAKTSQIQHVITFLQICQQEQKSLQMAFYVSEELINALEDCLEFSDHTKLIEIRESIRFRIHHPS